MGHIHHHVSCVECGPSRQHITGEGGLRCMLDMVISEQEYEGVN